MGLSSARPASAGPITRPRLNWADDRETAPRRSSLGTRSGTMAWKAGNPMAPDAPPRKARTTSTPGGSCPVAASTASTVAKAISAKVVTINQRRRSSRSARAPPRGASSPMGMKAAAATRPVQAGWSVRAKTRTPRATVCIHEPDVGDQRGRPDEREVPRPERAQRGQGHRSRLPAGRSGQAGPVGRSRPEWSYSLALVLAAGPQGEPPDARHGGQDAERCCGLGDLARTI